MAAVSEHTSTEADEDDMKTARELRIESHDPAVPEAYSAFMRTGWDDREVDVPRAPVADPATTRREKLAAMFPGERLVLPAGTFKVRANDTDYKFRPDTAHTYFSGNQTSDAVLVVENGESVLYARPRSGRDSDEFFRDRQYGQLWVGRRPSLREKSDSLGIECRHIEKLPDSLTATSGVKTRVLRGISTEVDRMVAADDALDADLQRVVAELKLVKDEWEVAQLQEAVDATVRGFEDVARSARRPTATSASAGSRASSRCGPGTTATTSATARSSAAVRTRRSCTGSHNHGATRPGELLLLDMGVESRNLYTADVTRTLPVNGTVHRAPAPGLRRGATTPSRPASTAIRPGVAFRDVTTPRCGCSPRR